MATTVTKIQMPFTSERTLPKAAIDPLVKDDYAGAIRFIYDLGDTPGYASQAAPTNGITVTNLANYTDTPPNGSIVVGAGQTPGFSGGGMVMTGISAAGTYLSQPAAVNADLWNAMNGKSQLFCVCLYVKLPTLANWNSQATIMPLFDGGAAYNAAPDLLLMVMQSSGSNIGFRRQVAAATVENTNTFYLTPKSGDYGGFAQIAYWRNDSGQWARLRSANGVTWSNFSPGGAGAAKGADNTQNFSSTGPRVGWGSFGSGTSPNGLNGLKHYRGWVSNLARETRDVPTLLDRDYTWTTARGVYT